MPNDQPVHRLNPVPPLSHQSLRSDLQVIPSTDGRTVVIVDSIAGKFTRVLASVWKQLQTSSASSTSRHDPELQSLWQQAAGAGWTRQRISGQTGHRFSPLSFRVPLFSIDRISQWLVPYSGLAFSAIAVAFWIVAGFAALLGVIVRWESWSGSLPSVMTYASELSPATLAWLFVVTKSVHELGHAIACRRQGGRPGVAGIWFLCWMPCPFVDVTDVWRVPHRFSRAIVMAAGMFAEWILAIVAVWVWLLSESPTIQLAAMNVVLVCGISTLLFNANPLMRYDGYFILSDFLDSANLRQEATEATRRLLLLPLRRWSTATLRIWLLSAYQLASHLYRIVLLSTIACVLLGYSQVIGAWRVMFSILLVAAAGLVMKSANRWRRMILGHGFWSQVPATRRMILASTIALALAALFVPIPRFHTTVGQLRCCDVQSVYLPDHGTLHEVLVNVGDQVDQGQLLVSVNDHELDDAVISVEGQCRVNATRLAAARVDSLQQPSASVNDTSQHQQWEILQSANSALQGKLASLRKRRETLRVIAPQSGVVLPPRQSISTVDPMKLIPSVGQPAHASDAWCRIATSTRFQVELTLDADQHRRIIEGTPVRVRTSRWGQQVLQAQVADVSPMIGSSANDVSQVVSEQSPDVDSHTIPEKYQVICHLTEVGPLAKLRWDDLVSIDGSECEVVIHCPPRTLMVDLLAAFRSFTGF